MAKRNRGTTKKKIEKWTLEGRGQGVREDYKPWLTIQDVPSEGMQKIVYVSKLFRFVYILKRKRRYFIEVLEYLLRI
ncbi:hypothetical protein [Oceanobacillus profundus]|uniref:Transposase n=1 Tax=Oceanobacillus profundus TaxID=372463 RepID=A0A417YBX2_9BACI|nr:hypothetical protein [Oceanobacillus profundus]MCM3397873.1 transposase [Oceanobacillus profundus]PAE28017.1 hypothetical protein CHI07_16500 [Paenibacillus sp. 7884-2]RHW30105.1 hypothetical protein D1B32_18715 [Oceanobacillus profundus]